MRRTGREALERMQRATPSVRAESVTAVLDHNVVLRRLHLTLAVGEITALVGVSGSGKTTLARCLTGMHQSDAGRILVGGQSLYAFRPDERRAAVGSFGVLLGGSTVFDSWSFGSMSVFDAVALPLRLQGIEEDTVQLRTERCLADLELTEVADRLPGQLAGHTWRRAAIARTLVGDPRLIVLDDPDSGLHAPHRVLVADAARATHTRTGATVLFTTHDLDLARQLADTVAVLGHGRVIATGPPAAVLARMYNVEELTHAFPGAGVPTPSVTQPEAPPTRADPPLGPVGPVGPAGR